MPRPRTGFLVIGVLLTASGLAFLRAEQLKLERSPVGATRLQKYFSTTCPVHPHTRCASHSALLRFRMRVPARVALEIRSTSGAVVRHLTPASGQAMPKGPVAVRWNGRSDAGAALPDGTYHLRVDLLSRGRTIDVPDPIVLDTTAPTIALTGRPGVVPLRFRVSEPAVVYALAQAVDGSGSVLLRGRRGRVRLRHTRLAGARVRITLVAIDRAGNPSAHVDAGIIRLPA